jgi:hypothetical protein
MLILTKNKTLIKKFQSLSQIIFNLDIKSNKEN